MAGEPPAAGRQVPQPPGGWAVGRASCEGASEPQPRGPAPALPGRLTSRQGHRAAALHSRAPWALGLCLLWPSPFCPQRPHTQAPTGEPAPEAKPHRISTGIPPGQARAHSSASHPVRVTSWSTNPGNKRPWKQLSPRGGRVSTPAGPSVLEPMESKEVGACEPWGCPILTTACLVPHTSPQKPTAALNLPPVSPSSPRPSGVQNVSRGGA